LVLVIYYIFITPVRSIIVRLAVGIANPARDTPFRARKRRESQRLDIGHKAKDRSKTAFAQVTR
jgi:hypothetical protein